MSYKTRVQDVGAALQTLKSFSKDYGFGEGSKGMINTVARRVANEIGKDNFGPALSNMDGDFYSSATRDFTEDAIEEIE